MLLGYHINCFFWGEFMFLSLIISLDFLGKKYSYMVFITLLLDFATIMNFPNKPFQKNVSWVLNKSNFKTNINSVIKLLRRLKYKIETVSF